VGSAGEGSPVGGASGDGSCRRFIDEQEGGGSLAGLLGDGVQSLGRRVDAQRLVDAESGVAAARRPWATQIWRRTPRQRRRLGRPDLAKDANAAAALTLLPALSLKSRVAA
jgi:hypothetical protein